MELDSYGIYSYFTGNIRSISLDLIQKVYIDTSRIKTNYGDFLLHSKLGQGTYGKLYSTLPDNTGKSYAMKIMELHWIIMKILEFHARITQIMKITDFRARIMKIMKIIEFNQNSMRELRKS